MKVDAITRVESSGTPASIGGGGGPSALLAALVGGSAPQDLTLPHCLTPASDAVLLLIQILIG